MLLLIVEQYHELFPRFLLVGKTFYTNSGVLNVLKELRMKNNSSPAIKLVVERLWRPKSCTSCNLAFNTNLHASDKWERKGNEKVIAIKGKSIVNIVCIIKILRLIVVNFYDQSSKCYKECMLRIIKKQCVTYHYGKCYDYL